MEQNPRSKTSADRSSWRHQQVALPHTFLATGSNAGHASTRELGFAAGEELTATACNQGWYWGYAKSREHLSGYFRPCQVTAVGAVEPSDPSPPSRRASHPASEMPRLDSALSAPRRASSGEKRKRPSEGSGSTKSMSGEGTEKVDSSDNATAKISHPKWEPPPPPGSAPPSSTAARIVWQNERAEGAVKKRKMPDDETGDGSSATSATSSTASAASSSSSQSSPSATASDPTPAPFNPTPSPAPAEPTPAPVDQTPAPNDTDVPSPTATTLKTELVDDDEQMDGSSVSIAAGPGVANAPPASAPIQLRVPDDRASGARFPPGCPVLHEPTDSPGIVRSVHIQLDTPAFQSGKSTYDVCYDVVMEGNSADDGAPAKAKPVPENELQFASRCPVLVSSSFVPKRPDGASGTDDNSEWISGKIVSSFKFIGDVEESYVVLIEGDGDGQAVGKVSGVPRDQIRFRPVTPAPSCAVPAMESTGDAVVKDARTPCSDAAVAGASKSDKDRQMPPAPSTQPVAGQDVKKTAQAEVREIIPEAACVDMDISELASNSTTSRTNNDSSDTMVRRMTIPDRIEFDQVRVHLVGPEHSINKKMKKSLRTDIFVVGNDLPPPKDASVVRDFGGLFPSPDRNGQYEPCILIRGPSNQVKSTIKVIVHLLVEKAYKGDDKEKLKAELVAHIDEDRQPVINSAAASPTKREVGAAMRTDLPGLQEKGNVEVKKSSDIDGDSSNIYASKLDKDILVESDVKTSNVIQREDGASVEPSHEPEANVKKVAGSPPAKRSQSELVFTTNESTPPLVCEEFRVPNWLHYDDVDEYFKGQHKQYIETSLGCKIELSHKSGYSIVVSIRCSEKETAWKAWGYITDNMLKGIKNERKHKFLYDLALYNSGLPKEEIIGRPVMHCQSPFDKEKKIYMVVETFPKGGNFAGCIIGQLSSHRKQVQSFGADFVVRQSEEKIGNYVLITGDTRESVEKAKDTVSSMIRELKNTHRTAKTRVLEVVWANEPLELKHLKRQYLDQHGTELDQTALGYDKLIDLVGSISVIHIRTVRLDSGGLTHILNIKKSRLARSKSVESTATSGILRADIEQIVRENEPMRLDKLKGLYFAKTKAKLDQAEFGYGSLMDLVASIPTIHIRREYHASGLNKSVILSIKRS